MRLFRKKSQHNYDPVELINVNAMDISTGMMNGYILSLKKSDTFKHLHMGYTHRNDNGALRFVIYAWDPDPVQLMYFNDRCPAMVEESIKKADLMPASWRSRYNTEFEELVEYEEEK